MFEITNNDFVKKTSHADTDFYYFLKPGLFAPEHLAQIESDMIRINESSLKLKYGIFDPQISFAEISKHLLICLMYQETVPVGFFYIYIVDENHVHLGLVIVSKNSGMDLLIGPYFFALLWLRDFLNTDYYATSLSAVPKIIESISTHVPNAFPTEKNFHRLSNKHYRRVLEIVFEAYVKKLFPFPEALTLDTKRFIVRSAAKEMGFERNIRNLPLAKNLMVNLFCDFWIDYAQNEDLFQVFQVDEETVGSIKTHAGEFYDKYQSSKQATV